jgi:hypothetical protein
MSIPATPSTISYDVDPERVAEAIVRRLLEGRAFVPARELAPA